MKKKKTKNNNNNRFILYLLVTALIGDLNYYTTRNLIFSAILVVISLLFFFLLIEKLYRKYRVLDIRTHECIALINQFIITLSINKSIVATFENVKDTFKGELKAKVESYDDLSCEEILENLKPYFNLNLYDFFVKILNQYVYNGGDILQLSHLLIFDSRKLQTSVDDFKSVTKRKIIDFSVLWGLSFLILVVVQLSLNMFYDKILAMNFFAPSIFVFFVVFLLFVYFFFRHSFNLSFINDWRENNEEIKNKN